MKIKIFVQIFVYFLLFMLLFSSNFVFGQFDPIQFDYLTSPDKNETSALSGRCSRVVSSEIIKCKFWQYRVMHDLEPGDLDKEISKAKSRIKEETKNFDKSIKDLCSAFNNSAAEIKKKIKGNKNLNEYEIKYFDEVLILCSNPTYEKYEKFLIDSIVVKKTETCKFSMDQDGWSIELKKVSDNKWVASIGPEGLCNSISLITLESEPDYPNLWKYTRTRTYADTEKEICKGLDVGKPLIYDWRENAYLMNCKFVEFGF